jgi:hypothetical protein
VRLALQAAGYRALSPEERFRLILAAGDRDDEVERDRLVGASPRVGCSLPDYYPFSQAFQEVTLQTYMELLDLSAHFFDALHFADAQPLDEDDANARRLLDIA